MKAGIPILCLLVLLLLLSPSHADENDWFEGTAANDDGATRDYSNRDAQLPWNNYMGDWLDADDTAQGNNAYDSTSLVDDDTPKWVEWDVTTLAQEWVDRTYPNDGLFLRAVGAGGTHKFYSRERADTNQRPRLIIVTAGITNTLVPTADTYLEPSTYQCFGDSTELRVSGNNNALFRFDLSGIAVSTTVAQATFRLYDYEQYSAADAGVFRCTEGEDLSYSEPILGLATNFNMDVGITGHTDVIFFTGFESPAWQSEWTSVDYIGAGTTLSNDPPRLFEMFQGKAARSSIPSGGNAGMTLSYNFQPETGQEPEEIYFRYYLRFANSWTPDVEGGKLPGISGTYGVAGWGGRKVNGTNGWSARGTFTTQTSTNNPLGAKDNPIGWYCYHADMPGTYGDIWLWTKGCRGYLENNRWYCVEQYAKMNTPGVNDGILRGWIDGRLAFEKTDIRFRDVTTLKIEKIWMNVYHGGIEPAPRDMDLYLDNVVIAKSYIGPAVGDWDQDELPDAWEREMFGHLRKTGNQDDDGDNVTNLDEYISGSDPDDGDDSLSLSIKSSNQQTRVFFTAIPARDLSYLDKTRHYALIQNTNLTTNAWPPVTGFEDRTDTGLHTHTVSGGGEMKFYRLKVWLSP